MATKAAALTGLALLCFPVANVRAGNIDPAQGCARNPAVVGKCFAVDGRVRVYDGSPSVRIWPKGSHRLLGVLPSEQENLPDDLKKVINPDTDAFADMTVCPFTEPKTGEMQFVCVEAASDIRAVSRH